MKRILSVLLALAMLLSLFSINVFAEAEDPVKLDFGETVDDVFTSKYDTAFTSAAGGILGYAKTLPESYRGTPIVVIVKGNTDKDFTLRIHHTPYENNVSVSEAVAEPQVKAGDFNVAVALKPAVKEDGSANADGNYLVLKHGYDGTEINITISEVSVFKGTLDEYNEYLASQQPPADATSGSFYLKASATTWTEIKLANAFGFNMKPGADKTVTFTSEDVDFIVGYNGVGGEWTQTDGAKTQSLDMSKVATPGEFSEYDKIGFNAEADKTYTFKWAVTDTPKEEPTTEPSKLSLYFGDFTTGFGARDTVTVDKPGRYTLKSEGQVDAYDWIMIKGTETVGDTENLTNLAPGTKILFTYVKINDTYLGFKENDSWVYTVEDKGIEGKGYVEAQPYFSISGANVFYEDLPKPATSIEVGFIVDPDNYNPDIPEMTGGTCILKPDSMEYPNTLVSSTLYFPSEVLTLEDFLNSVESVSITLNGITAETDKGTKLTAEDLTELGKEDAFSIVGGRTICGFKDGKFEYWHLEGGVGGGTTIPDGSYTMYYTPDADAYYDLPEDISEWDSIGFVFTISIYALDTDASDYITLSYESFDFDIKYKPGAVVTHPELDTYNSVSGKNLGVKLGDTPTNILVATNDNNTELDKAVKTALNSNKATNYYLKIVVDGGTLTSVIADDNGNTSVALPDDAILVGSVKDGVTTYYVSYAELVKAWGTAFDATDYYGSTGPFAKIWNIKATGSGTVTFAGVVEIPSQTPDQPDQPVQPDVPALSNPHFSGVAILNVGEYYHAIMIGPAIVTYPHDFDENGICVVCGYVRAYETSDVDVVAPTEGPTTEDDPEEAPSDIDVDDSDNTAAEPAPEKNPTTGIAFGVIPALAAAAFAVATRKH